MRAIALLFHLRSERNNIVAGYVDDFILFPRSNSAYLLFLFKG